MPKSQVYACYIALNAAQNIRASIESVADVVDGVVVIVDDRTDDDTEDQISEAGEVSFDGKLIVKSRKWNHSFSDARNCAVLTARETAVQDGGLEDLRDLWILTMDADEELDPKSAPLFRRCVDRGEVDLWTMPLLVDPSYGAPAYKHPEFGRCGIVFRNRMFRADRFGFRFRVHEQLANIDDRDDWKEDVEKVRFFHYGRMSWEKDYYYTALMLLDHIDMPDEPIPATMLAEAAIQADDTIVAAKYLSRVDPDRVKAGPIAAKYWTTKGKMGQKAWIQAAVANLPKNQVFRPRDEALACYLKAFEMNPAEPDAALHAATVLWTGYRDRDQEAVDLLVYVVDQDPACIVASHMLLLYRDFGEPPNGDRETFLRRLGEYLVENANMQTDARLEAEGRTPGDAEAANIERLDDIVHAGERQSGAQVPASMNPRDEGEPARSAAEDEFDMGDR